VNENAASYNVVCIATALFSTYRKASESTLLKVHLTAMDVRSSYSCKYRERIAAMQLVLELIAAVVAV